MRYNNNIEILAPAGSVEGMRAAFAAGADAVYIGGQSFGARAYAQNADPRSLLDAIDEAHLHKKRLYLTVNTLLKNRELYGELITYLKPYYEQGLDAVLVQDLGVLKMIREIFPDLPVHASTQMTVCGPDYGLWLKQQGVKRLVLPRELGIEEIRSMKDRTGIEIEVFVHGALCYCYSGQCLMSSMIGGRSGNRGRCAQPCRLTYEFKDGGKIKTGHLLSMKDLCGLEALPDLIDAGVDSLKIEGRMKKPEYAALTSRIYRYYADKYLERGSHDFRIEPEDLRDLMDLYSRGGFTKGYYHMYNGPVMITPGRPNHSGTGAGEIVRVKGSSVYVRLKEDIGAGDVLELPDGREITAGHAAPAGREIELRTKTSGINKGQTVLRTKNAALIDSLSEKYVKKPELKEKIYGFVRLSKDLDAKMELYCGDQMVSVSGAKAGRAEKLPLTEAAVRKQIEKTGGTPFMFEKLEISMPDDLFIPVSELNALRRKAFSELTEKICGSFRRSSISDIQPERSVRDPERHTQKTSGSVRLHVLVTSEEHLEECLQFQEVRRIYMELSADPELIGHAVHEAHRTGREFWPAMPWIWRSRVESILDQEAGRIADHHADGFLVRNMESLFWLRNHAFSLPCISDSSVYMMNDEAFETGMPLFDEITMPVELNRHELAGMHFLESSEVIVYGKIPLMVSAQCLVKNCGACTGLPGFHLLKDRMNKNMLVMNDCKWCCNVITNSVPLFIPEVLSGDTGGRRPYAVRLQFTDENAAQTRQILETFSGTGTSGPADYTKGHYKRGVE